MRRPWLSIAVAGGALVALAVPALQMNVVTSSVDDLPQDLGLIKTYNHVRDVFPDKGVTAIGGRAGGQRPQREMRPRAYRCCSGERRTRTRC